MRLNSEFIQNLPDIVDDEKNPVRVEMIFLPHFVRYDSELKSFIFKPSEPSRDLGNF